MFFAADSGEKLKAVYNIYPQNVLTSSHPLVLCHVETRVAGAALQAWCGLWHAVRPGRLVRVVGLRREPLVAFLKAYKRGSQWMLDHPDEAAQLAVKHAIDGKDPPAQTGDYQAAQRCHGGRAHQVAQPRMV
jgi:hypothetical protein